MWAFCLGATLGVLLTITILPLQYSCYPYHKDEEKETAKWLIKADQKKRMSELRIETRSPEVSFLETFPLSSSFESFFSTGAGRLKSGQYWDRFSFPEENKALQAHFTEAASPLGLPRFCSSRRTLQNPAIRPVQPERFQRRWQRAETAHYLTPDSHDMFLWTSETNLWSGPWWEPDWLWNQPDLPSENVPIPPLHPVCVYWRKNKFSFKSCTCICTVTFLAVTSWLYLKSVIKRNSG